MEISTLQIAIDEAKRFIIKCEGLKESRKNKRSYIYDGKVKYYDNPSPKESGLVRRSSMDLTRVLADLRMGR